MKILGKALIIFVIVVLIIAAVFAAVLYFSGEDPAQYAGVVDDKVDMLEQEIRNDIEGSLAGVEGDAAGGSNSSAGQATEADGQAGQTAQPDGPDGAAVPDPGKERLIREAYTNAFYKLEDSANGMLEQLVAEAAADYAAMAKNDEVGNSAKVDLASTYIKRADVLESRYDDSVEQLLVDLQMQLTRIGFSDDEAAGIAGEYRTEYQARKEDRRAELKAKIDAAL